MKISPGFTRTFFSLIPAIALLLPFAPVTRAQTAEKPYVILVSIDGFRYDYAERFKTKNILAIRDNGAAAESMIPSFPSVTFPNHISIVTGSYPEHHGIVGNTFFDPTRNAEYTMRNDATDGSWYQSATPLWVLAAQQHMISACMFWPTCDGEVLGVRPEYFRKYDGTFPNEARVKQVLDWLQLPADKRPHFITLYFSDVDTAGHRFGPESLETAAAAQLVDSMIGKLREGLSSLKLPVNMILVSDHGMQDVQDGGVNLAGSFDASKVRVELDGPVALIYCKDAQAVEETYLRLKKNSKLEVYRRVETPAWWHYNENPRSGDLVAIVKGSAIFTLKDPTPERALSKGEHGYDPREFKTMHAIFYAVGPNIKPQTVVPSFENVNVYPFIARILGLKLPEKLDGSPAVLNSIYRQ